MLYLLSVGPIIISTSLNCVEAKRKWINWSDRKYILAIGTHAHLELALASGKPCKMEREGGRGYRRTMHKAGPGLQSKDAVHHSDPDNSICPECEKVIKDSSDDSIFCDGDCKQWLHRCCADLSRTEFERLGDSNEPFYCLRCCCKKQSSTIKELHETVCSFAARIEELQAATVRAPLQSSSSPSSVSISSIASASILKDALHHGNPENSSVEGEGAGECICPICKKVIKDSSDDSIFCDGDCKQWLHRCCADLSRTEFAKLGDSNEPFYCRWCCYKKQSSTIKELHETVCSFAARMEELQAATVRAPLQSSSSPSSVSISSIASASILNDALHHSDPKNSSVECEEAGECICPICKKVIKDSSDDGSIFCDGNCKQWLHRCCADLSKTEFAKLGESSEPFYCLRCCCKKQSSAIKELHETVRSFAARLEELAADRALTRPSSSPSSLSISSIASASAPATVGLDCVTCSTARKSNPHPPNDPAYKAVTTSQFEVVRSKSQGDISAGVARMGKIKAVASLITQYSKLRLQGSTCKMVMKCIIVMWFLPQCSLQS